MTLTLEALPMQEAIAFWKDKIQLGPAAFAKLDNEARLKAFAVSGIAKGDELSSVYQALQRAIEDGISYGEFKKQCAEIFARRGWSGKREWRVQNIFRTNIQTAYNAGRWQRQKERTGSFPYLMYNAVNDRRTRPTHRAMDGKVFPAEHPFWDTWYPPNGFRCRCSVLSLTEGQVKRRGLTVETEDPTNTAVLIPHPATGEQIAMQQLLPDPGFNYHPGKAAFGGIGRVARKQFEPLPDLRGPDDYRRPALRNIRPAAIDDLDESALLPAGRDDEFYRQAFVERFGEQTILTDGAGEPVVLSLRSYLIDKTPGAAPLWKFGKAGHGQAIGLLAEMIERPLEIWLTPQKDPASGTVRLAKRYVGLWKSQDKQRLAGLAVFEVADGEFQGVTAFAPMKGGEPDLDYAERQRRGLLLYPR
jgi:SPP1 gp7 family putative phage head morphogenesis protein